jgi:GST-like protein
MIKFYYHPSPNPAKVALFLEEAGLEYEYNFETRRHWKILDDRLAGRKYLLGDVYTIVDMSVWGWARAAAHILGAETWSKMANVKRLVDEIDARPAVARVDKLKDKHAFKQEFDEEARRHLFPHQTQKAS